MTLLDKYRTACEAFEVPPQEEIETALSVADETGELDLSRGNSSDNACMKKLSDEEVLPVLDALCDSTIVAVSLEYNNLGDMAAKGVSSVLKHNTSLATLNLAYNNLSQTGIKVIIEALDHNSSLLRLNLDGNDVGKVGLSVSQLLQVNSTLEELSLDNCAIDTASLIAIFTVLSESNDSLRVLSVANPRLFSVQDEIMTHVARCLRANRRLVSLSLARSSIGVDGIARVAEELALSGNNSLQVLNLSSCHLPPTSGVHISTILQYCPSLKHLNIASNRLERAGIADIAIYLKTAETELEYLDVTNNSLNDHGLTLLSDALHVNSSIRTVKVWGNDFGELACPAWSDLLANRGSGVDLHTDITTRVVDGNVQVAMQCE